MAIVLATRSEQPRAANIGEITREIQVEPIPIQEPVVIPETTPVEAPERELEPV